MEVICTLIDGTSCPNCGNKQFIVFEQTQTAYLVNKGEVDDSRELGYKALGKCTKCKAEIEMLQTPTGFIPCSKLRKLLFNYIFDKPNNNIKYIKNPMEANNGR